MAAPSTPEKNYFIGNGTAKCMLSTAEAQHLSLDEVFASLRDASYLKVVRGVHLSLENRYVEISFTDEKALDHLVNNGLKFKISTPKVSFEIKCVS